MKFLDTGRFFYLKNSGGCLEIAFPILLIFCLFLSEPQDVGNLHPVLDVLLEQISGDSVTGPTQMSSTANTSFHGMRSSLALRIAALVPPPGDYETAYPGMTLFRKNAPSPCLMASVEPSLSIFLQGRKRINLGPEEFMCDESSFLISCIDVPIQSQIVEASAFIVPDPLRFAED